MVIERRGGGWREGILGCFCHWNNQLGNHLRFHINVFDAKLLDENSQWCSCRHGAKPLSRLQVKTAAVLIFERSLVILTEQEQIPHLGLSV